MTVPTTVTMASNTTALIESPIANWYSNQTLFITGSTGFMGKVLVEKLLRECPDIKACYLLMRTKRGIEPEQRHDDYVNHMVSVTIQLINIIAHESYTIKKIHIRK